MFECRYWDVIKECWKEWEMYIGIYINKKNVNVIISIE
jgi:Fe-S cluster biosynthesis and repair protein YggX